MQTNELHAVLEQIELDNQDLYNIVMDVNSWNGALDYLEYYSNDEDFFNTFYGGREDGYSEVARAVCYGDYNYMDPYVKIDAYGNLTSVTRIELECELEESKVDILESYLDSINDGNNSYIEYDSIICFDDLDRDSQRVLATYYPDLFAYNFDEEDLEEEK